MSGNKEARGRCKSGGYLVFSTHQAFIVTLISAFIYCRLSDNEEFFFKKQLY